MGGLVKGIDIREANVARARRIRQILDYEPQRLNFEVQDLFDLANGAQSFDLILFLGILYHLENPIGALRLVHKRARRAVILETQLTRQAAPIVSGWGQTGVTLELEASLALYQETDAETNRRASKNCVSFIPNVAAVRQMLLSAGFTTVRQLPAAKGLNFQYVQNDRAVFVQFYRASKDGGVRRLRLLRLIGLPLRLSLSLTGPGFLTRCSSLTLLLPRKDLQWFLSQYHENHE